MTAFALIAVSEDGSRRTLTVPAPSRWVAIALVLNMPGVVSAYPAAGSPDA